jgi:hypothetical protein
MRTTATDGKTYVEDYDLDEAYRRWRRRMKPMARRKLSQDLLVGRS